MESQQRKPMTLAEYERIGAELEKDITKSVFWEPFTSLKRLLEIWNHTGSKPN
jgi:hypothetical protein